jgi:hypothetical protein
MLLLAVGGGDWGRWEIKKNACLQRMQPSVLLEIAIVSRCAIKSIAALLGHCPPHGSCIRTAAISMHR